VALTGLTLAPTAMLELFLGETGPPHTARWLRDSTPLGSAFPVEGAALRRLEEVRLAFQSLFQMGRRPLADPEQLRALGEVLYDTFFRPVAGELAGPSGERPLRWLIHSPAPAFLNLPWELVWLPGADLPLGCDPAWALLRVPAPTAPVEPAPPDPGPLRLLFLAAAPEGDVPLDYEREEEAMLRATERLDLSVVVLPFAETGGIAELAEAVTRHRPHVVHLSGHGIVDPRGTGWFAFEDERGRSAAEPAAEIAGRVFRGSSVRCTVLNGCQTGQAAAAGLAGQLVASGVPLVLGWGASVIDDTATSFIAGLYQHLAGGERVPAAAARARQDVWRTCRVKSGDHELWDATFALPWLFAAGPDPDLIDREAPPRKYEGPKTELMLLGDEIKGLREGFVGRRRVQQTLIPPLRGGAYTVAVLTGLGGMGKSTLATRAAGRLREAGFEVTGIKALRGNDPAEAGRLFLVEKLLPALALPFMAREADIYKAICNGEYPVAHRITLAVTEWKKRRLALVIDNFEDVLDADTRAIADPGLRVAYRTLTRDLTEGSRLVVTCRYLPADTPDPGATPHVLWLDLKDLKEFELVKFLRRDARVEARMRAGAIPGSRVRHLHRAFGGTPGFLVQARALLAEADLDGWDEEEPDETPLEEVRQRYCEQIMLPRLYGLLPPLAQGLVSRLAVSELPLPPDGLARLAQQPEPEAEASAGAAANYGLVQVFAEAGKPIRYHVPGLIRGWMTAEERLSGQARKGVDETLARFWKESYERHREEELQVAIDVELLTCREHAGRAELTEEFRWATVWLARRLIGRAEWKMARALLEEVAETARDGSAWHQLATIDLYEGSYAAARDKFARALAIEQAIGDRAGEAATWHNLASIDVREGSYAAARDKLARSLAMRQAVGDRAGEADTWHNLATIDLHEGSYAAAREKSARALAIKQAIGDRAGEAATWCNLAAIDLEEGSYAAAREKSARALAMRQAIGDRAGEADTWHQLATIDLNEGSYAAARDKFARALAIKQAIGDRAGEAATWHNLASIDVREGSYAAAREKSARSLAMRQAIGDRAGEAATWNNLASIDLEEGSYAAARDKLARSLAIVQAIGDRAGGAATWHNLASIDLYEGSYAAAREKSARALAMRQAIGDRAGEAATWHQLATIDVNEGSYAAARDKFAKALAMRQAIGDRAGEAATWHNLATIDLNEGSYAAARDKFARSLAIVQAIGDRAGEAATWNQLGLLAWKQGAKPQAVQLIALCYLLDNAIGHADTKRAFENLSGMCAALDFSRDQFNHLLTTVAESYQQDRGASLLKAAFPG
jgi:tetratricopeptide (TPR) repeat protein